MSFEETIQAYDGLINLIVKDFMHKYHMPYHLKEDLKQEVLFTLYKKLPEYDKERASITTYIRNNAKYSMYKYIRRVKSKEVELTYSPAVESVDTVLYDLQLKDLVYDVQMDSEHENYIVYLYVIGYTQREIAEMSGTYQQDISKIIIKYRKNFLQKYAKYDILNTER